MDKKLLQKLENNNDAIVDLQAQIEQAVAPFQAKLKDLQTKDADMRAQLKEAMIKNNVKSFEAGRVKLTLVAESTRKTLDSKKLKAEAPGIYDKYVKTSTVAASVRITVKD